MVIQSGVHFSNPRIPRLANPAPVELNRPGHPCSSSIRLCPLNNTTVHHLAPGLRENRKRNEEVVKIAIFDHQDWPGSARANPRER